MTLSGYAIHGLVKLIKDFLSDREWTALFNKWGARDVYDEQVLPDIGKTNGQHPSKTEYITKRLLELNVTTTL